MPDDKNIQDGRDRSKVAAEQQYELAYFAKKHGLTANQAREILHASGPDRARADRMAEERR